MKYLVVLACALVVVYGLPPEIEEKIKSQIMQAAGECKGEIGASDDDIAPIKAHEPPTTHNGKCFIACMNKKFGFQDASGKIDKETAYAMIEKLKPVDADMYEKMKHVTDTCVGQATEDADECETAVNMFTCAEKENKAIGMKSFDM